MVNHWQLNKEHVQGVHYILMGKNHALSIILERKQENDKTIKRVKYQCSMTTTVWAVSSLTAPEPSPSSFTSQTDGVMGKKLKYKAK